jgi:hypothetical protein
VTDRFYIDDNDAYAKYGVFVAEGGYNELIAFPPLKTPKSIDWHEEDGIEADLSAPVLNTKDFSMKFAFAGEQPRLGAFIELLSDMAYHTFYFKEIGRTFRLRMVSHTNLRTVMTIGLLTLRLADDFPLDGYTYAAPASTIAPHDDYDLDGRLFTEYGVRVLEGTLDEINKSPAVKQNLLRNIGSKSGAIYDGEAVTFAAKDVKAICLMRAETLAELWQNYNALLYDLTRPEERVLYSDATGLEYPCYYKSSTVSEFCASGKVWLKFTLTLVFTSFRVGDDDYLLASEDGELFVLEEDDETFIDMGLYGD